MALSTSLPATAAHGTDAGADIVAVLQERLVAQQGAKANAQKTIDEDDAALTALRRTAEVEQDALAALSDALVANHDERDRLASAYVELVAGAFVGSSRTPSTRLPRPGQETNALFEDSLARTAIDYLRRQLASNAQHEDEIEKGEADHNRRLGALQSQILDRFDQRDEHEQALASIQAAIDSLTLNIAQRQGDVPVLPGVGVPVIVLDAHLRAARRMSTLDPDCGVTWWVLAAIGSLESGNGRGRAIDIDGRIAGIIGRPLDGSDGTALIVDSDGGELDGDKLFDRAVGPMQFIPSTWRKWASDGNDDGVADPSNAYDASLSAARYLCASRGDDRLDSGAGLGRAAFEYNHSLMYVARVLREATRLQESDLVPSRRVTVITLGQAALFSGAVIDGLAAAGWQPEALASGSVASVQAALAPLEGAPAILQGTLLVVTDASTDGDVADTIALATSVTSGLRTVVVTAAPTTTVTSATVTVAPLEPPWSSSLPIDAAQWVPQVVATIG